MNVVLPNSDKHQLRQRPRVPLLTQLANMITASTAGRSDTSHEAQPEGLVSHGLVTGMPEPNEFSVIMLLIRTASIINASSTDGDIVITGVDPEPHLPDNLTDKTSRVHLTTLEASAAILVQGGEVIAAAYTPDSGAVLITDAAVANIKSELDMAADHSVPVDTDNVILVESESRLYPLNITAISNPETEPQAPAPHNPHNLRVVEPGQNLWKEFKDGYKWAYVLV